jgi:hypothetical protein
MLNSNPRLARFYRFFETYGAERLNGLDESYFVGLNEFDKEEAWNFLLQGESLSEERINGLYLLNDVRAVDLFKEILASPIKDSPYSAQRQFFEYQRLTLLGYVNNADPSTKNIVEMTKYSDSEFPKIRAKFAQVLPLRKIAPCSVDALKKMIFTEVERIPLAAAITKFMAIHGMDYEIDDPVYNSIYISLRSGGSEEKLSAMKRLEMIWKPDYL